MKRALLDWALFLLILLMCCVGCGGPVDHVEYWADSTIPPEDAAAACAAWTAGVGVECRAVDSGRANVLITAFRDNSGTGGITYDWMQPISIKINLTYSAHIGCNLTHELGHAMGIGHLDTAPAAMNASAETYCETALTDVDVDGWNAVYPK